MSIPYRYFLSELHHSIEFNQLALIITQGKQSIHPCFTSEYLAGQYAYWQATETNAVELREIKRELKFLAEIGAVFDFDLAYLEAQQFKKIMQLEDSKALWV